MTSKEKHDRARVVRQISDDFIHESDSDVVEQLYKEAGIDYNHRIIRNASVSQLYEEALTYEEGTALTSTGYVCVGELRVEL